MDVLDYQWKCENGMGAMTISGIMFPDSNMDVLAKIWSSVRKRNFEDFGVSVTGLFMYNKEGLPLVTCSWFLDYGYAETEGIDIAKYNQLFDETFDKQMERFKAAVNTFVESEWFDAYVALVQNDALPRQIDEFLTRFLLENGVKTQKDEDKKLRREAKKRDQEEHIKKVIQETTRF